MNSDALHERGQALEDMFFRNKDQKLLEKMKSDLAAKDAQEALTAVSGIDDKDVLSALVESGITAESLASVSLIPLVAVAWADGKMEPNERDAVLKAAEQSGIREDDAAHGLIESWLKVRPGPELLDVWKDYVGSLKQHLEGTAYHQLRETVLRRAESVASAAGGILGFGNKVSAEERAVLEELKAAFGS